MNRQIVPAFYSGEALMLGDQTPATQPVQSLVVRKTLVDYLPLIIAVITLALTLYMLSQQQKRRVQ